MKHYDVIIAGGGVIGKSIAFRLEKKQQLNILCIDPHYKANGSASLAAGAMLGAFGEITVDKTSFLDQKELEFRIRAAQLYPDFLNEIEESSRQTIYQMPGTFVIANNAGKQDRFNLQKIAQELQTHDQPYQWVEPTEIPNFKPNREYLAYQALYMPKEGSVSSADLLDGLTRALECSKRVSFLNDVVQSLVVQESRLTGVVTAQQGEIYADHVILCAGVGVQKILDQSPGVSQQIPMLMPGKGVSLVLETETMFEHVIRTPNRDFACGTHVVPRGRNSVYVGATNRIANTPGLREGITTGELHSLLHSAIHEINTSLRTANVQTTLFGSRPITIDRYPLVGKTDLEGLYVATGTYRNGILMAPLIAEIVSDELLQRSARYENAFSPVNRGLVLTDVSGETLIEAGIRDLVNFIQEPGGSLPYNRAQELENFLQVLTRAVLLDDNQYKQLISDSRELIDRYPIAEIIPQLFYQYHSVIDEQRKNEKASSLSL